MTSLQKNLTFTGLTMIAVGSCIGSGIFITPYEVVRALPHPGYVLLIWAVGGLIAICGALSFAELGAMFPHAGGVYVYLREAYGPAIGFLYGWVILLVINTGALAALALALAEYLAFFYPLGQEGKVLLAAGVILLLTVYNITGVRSSDILAKVFTGLKLLAMAGIIGVAFVAYEPGSVDLDLTLTEHVPDNLIGALLLALVGVFFSFGGWHHASYVAGEAQDPQRTVPRAMIFGAGIVTVAYVLINLAYMLLLPLPAIAGSTRVAGDAVATVIPFGGQLVAVAIAISIFGTIGIYTMSAPRIYFAMARDGLFFPALARLHPRFHTPVNAMLLQAFWAILLLLFWGTFSNLITYVTFMDIAFMCLAGLSLFLLRRKQPGRERPYRVAGYPWVPLLYVAVTGAFVLSTVVQRPVQALAGLVVLGLGIGALRYFRAQKSGADTL